jgi:hypothetical protein
MATYPSYPTLNVNHDVANAFSSSIVPHVDMQTCRFSIAQ